MVTLDLIRAAVIGCLPFVDQVWQIYGLIFALQAASAGFTPAFQALVPDVLRDEEDYTNALSLLRLAEDVEQVASPVVAAALLTVVSFPVLFVGTVVGFAVSALLVGTARLPVRAKAERGAFWQDVTKGLRICARTPRLRELMAMEAAVGFGFSLAQTPVGRIINRSAREADRGAIFAAQFALSHACWLVTYPLAGWIGAGAGLVLAALVLAAIGLAGCGAVLWLWPAREGGVLRHDHPDLPRDHPHLGAGGTITPMSL